MREFSNLSDFLFEHTEQIRAQYRDPPSARWMPDYGCYRPEIDFLTDVMDAVRLLPGLDVPDVPGVTNMFGSKLAEALSRYRRARPATGAVGVDRGSFDLVRSVQFDGTERIR